MEPHIPENKPPRKRPFILYRLVRILGAISAIGTLTAFLANVYWIPDLFAHFRVQYLLLLAVWMVCELVAKRYYLALTLVCLWFINFAWVMPYLIPAQRTTGEESTSYTKPLKVVSFNVLRTNEELDETLKLILDQKPDIVFMMEVQNEWKKRLEATVDTYPHQKILAVPDYTGIAFLSKLPWNNIEVIKLGKVRNPSIVVEIPIEGASQPLTLVATHPLPPFGPGLTESRDDQLDRLTERLQGKPCTLLVGDLNLTPWSPRFHKILKSGELSDASQGWSIGPTLTPIPTVFGGLKVDHVFKGRDIQVRGFRLVSSWYSDHQMIVFDFAVPGKE